MKKEYLKPQMAAIEIQSEQFIATSPILSSSPGIGNGETDVLSEGIYWD